jgi:threonine/homoserine efflux transporter RhtA
MFIALTMCPPSVYQMMRGIITVITAVLSIIFLGRQQYRHHWTGLVCIILGVAEVGYIAILYENKEDSDE